MSLLELELYGAAADHNWSARRRRRRPNVGVTPAPFSWRVQSCCTPAICC